MIGRCSFNFFRGRLTKESHDVRVAYSHFLGVEISNGKYYHCRIILSNPHARRSATGFSFLPFFSEPGFSFLPLFSEPDSFIFL